MDCINTSLFLSSTPLFVLFFCTNKERHAPKRPHDGVYDELELGRVHLEERVEAVVADGTQQAEKLQPMLRVVL